MKTSTLLTLLLLGGLVAEALAADHHGPRCGACGCSKVRKVCRLVCEQTDQLDFEYDVDCEDYCLLGKSDICGKKWVRDCNSPLGCRKQLVWQPHCSCKIRTRKTLVKIPVIKKVPVYTCVVECVCRGCGKAEVDPVATAQAREHGIMPVAADMPIVLEDTSSESEPVEEQDPTEKTQTGKLAKSSHSFLQRLFGK